MITTFSHLPHPHLASFVRGYGMRQTSQGDSHLRVPMAARAQVTMYFHFTPPSIVFEPRSARKVDSPSPDPVIDKRTQRYFEILPGGGPPGILYFQIPPSNLLEQRVTGNRNGGVAKTMITGPLTHRRFDVLLLGPLEMFTVEFAPTALHALFGIPMVELTDSALGPENLWGVAAARQLYDRLGAEATFAGRVAVIEEDLLKRVSSRNSDPIAAAATRLWRAGGTVRIDDLARASHLSARQFHRQFTHRVGVPPKTYARMVRLNVAIATKVAQPDVSWTYVAQCAGYFDEAHLDKDFRDLADTSPSGLMAGN
jgi:AraC-like DNA-binding protein